MQVKEQPLSDTDLVAYHKLQSTVVSVFSSRYFSHINISLNSLRWFSEKCFAVFVHLPVNFAENSYANGSCINMRISLSNAGGRVVRAGVSIQSLSPESLTYQRIEYC